MGDYNWVDQGLATLGLTLDLSVSELPKICRPGPNDKVTVHYLMNSIEKCFINVQDSLLQPIATKNIDQSWAVSVGRYDGNPHVTDYSVLTKLVGVNRDDFLKFIVDDAMIDIAKLWDETFVEGRFTHVITKDGKVIETKQAIGGPLDYDVQDVAKIMKWVFTVPGLAKREIISVYVTKVTPDSMFTSYFPLKGRTFPTPNGIFSLTARGKLMVPCLDRVVFDATTGECTFEHYATASLEGWMPSYFQNSGFGKKKFFEGSCVEIQHLREMLLKHGQIGKEFEKVRRRDGTSFL